MRHLPKLHLYLIFALLAGCSDNNIVKDEGQEVYFEVVTETHAWEHKYEGFLIDAEGNIRQYTNPETWISVDSIMDQISVANMKSNIDQTVLSGKKIDSAELKNYISKIANITESNFSKVQLSEADPVSKTYYAYRFNAQRAIYEPVLIFENIGTTGRLNSDPNAVEIYNWLKDVSKM